MCLFQPTTIVNSFRFCTLFTFYYLFCTLFVLYLFCTFNEAFIKMLVHIKSTNTMPIIIFFYLPKSTFTVFKRFTLLEECSSPPSYPSKLYGLYEMYGLMYEQGYAQGHMDANTRHENPSSFDEICSFETKIGDLRESCRFDEKLFFREGGGVFIFSELRTGACARNVSQLAKAPVENYKFTLPSLKR